jgi:hypothetical protein
LGEKRIKENNAGVNLTMIYCKNFCKCHNVPPVQQQYGKKFLKRNKNKKAPFTYSVRAQ